MQLFLGILLEMVHKWWRVLIVYCLGVIAGTSTNDSNVFQHNISSNTNIITLLKPKGPLQLVLLTQVYS